jgi:dihydrofolate synthase/folylpolyglutamate synthase
VLTVIESVKLLNQRGFSIPDAAVFSALENTVELTGLQGRWQTISEHPLVICDTGHNIAGIQEVLENISVTQYDQLHIVIGMLKDKDVTSVLKLLPTTAKYYFCQPDLERAMPASELAEKASEVHLYGQVYENVNSALTAAKNKANSEDLIFIGGSTFIVAEVL